MAYKTIETITHDYGPVNKYIDEKARLKKSRSVWGYTRSLALFLVAFGIFLILAAYAYHIFKKPHENFFVENDIVKSQKLKQDLNEVINKKDEEIESKEKEVNNNPENEKLKKDLETLKKEKEELEKKLNNIVYTEEVSIFKKYDVNSNLTVTTGFGWNKLDDLRSGKKHDDDWCYIDSNLTTAKYYFNVESDQSLLLKELGISKSEAASYKKHCYN